LSFGNSFDLIKKPNVIERLPWLEETKIGDEIRLIEGRMTRT
jgi:hypothetical protein